MSIATRRAGRCISSVYGNANEEPKGFRVHGSKRSGAVIFSYGTDLQPMPCGAGRGDEGGLVPGLRRRAGGAGEYSSRPAARGAC